MTTYFDLLGAQNRDHGERGIARLISQLALQLEHSYPSVVDHYIVHPHLPVPQSLEPLLASGKLIRSDRVEERAGTGGTFIAGSVVELEESLETVLPHWARGPGWHTLAILFDLIPLRFSDEYLADDQLRSAYLDRVAAYGSFDHLLPISETSQRDAAELIAFPRERQTVIYAGVDDRFRPPEAGSSRPTISGLRDGYVLFPTGMDWRKNVDRTIEAYGALPAEVRTAHQLVLACRLDPWMVEALQAQAEKAGLSPDQLVLPGYLSDEELVELYQHAALAIFPSLYEGFGLPVLEAMRCGTPTICADNSSLREVQAYPGARFDASDTASITSALKRALTDSQHRQQIAEQPVPEFTWGRSAGLLVEVLAATDAQAVRPRLAVVSPYPPQASGIANYSSRLLPELADLAEVTLFTAVNDEEGDVDFAEIDGVEVRPLNELDDVHFGGQPFDRVLYMMGNSRFHAKALRSLTKTGGAVMFHDARFTGLYNEMYRLSPVTFGASHVGAKLDDLYPDRYRQSVTSSHTIEPDQAARFGIQMATEIASHASHRFCHSDYAARTLELDTGQAIEHLFDLPLPTIDRPRTSARTDLICAFGIVDPMKRVIPLIDACAVMERGLTLRFVGECEPGLKQSLESHAADRGLAVEFTGYVTDEELLHHQLEATLAVQLRGHSNGESSGAVAELIAAQTPTVVSKIGAMAELPSEAVRFVGPDASSSEIAAAIEDLLSDPHAVLRMQEAARRYAETFSYGAAARSLVAALGL